MSYFRHGDPLDDFNRLDRMQAEYDARLPVCDECKQRIHEEDYYNIAGEILCEECMNRRYRRRTEDLVNAYE